MGHSRHLSRLFLVFFKQTLLLYNNILWKSDCIISATQHYFLWQRLQFWLCCFMIKPMKLEIILIIVLTKETNQNLVLSFCSRILTIGKLSLVHLSRQLNSKQKLHVQNPREPSWSSGYGRRLVFKRSRIRISAPHTGWPFFHIDLL